MSDRAMSKGSASAALRAPVLAGNGGSGSGPSCVLVPVDQSKVQRELWPRGRSPRSQLCDCVTIAQFLRLQPVLFITSAETLPERSSPVLTSTAPPTLAVAEVTNV